MRFDYFDMLSGDPLYLENVGHLRSPFLRELKPAGGIGYRAYNLYLNFLTWDKESLLKYAQLMQYKGAERLDRECFNAFDIVTLLPQTRELCRGVLSFFMTEQLVWEESHRQYDAVLAFEGDKPAEYLGKIDRENFDEVRGAMLQLNFIGLDKDGAPIAHSSEKAKKLWEKTQGFLKEQAKAESKEDKPEYHLSNIISKICTIHPRDRKSVV